MRGHLLTVVLAALSVVLVTFVTPALVLMHRNLHDQLTLRATELAVELLPQARQAHPPTLQVGPDNGFATSILTFPTPAPDESRPYSTAVEDARASCHPAQVDTSDGVEVVLPVRGAFGCDTVVRVVARYQALPAQPGMLTLLTFALVVAAALVAVLLAHRLARSLVRSISALALAADRLAAGDLAARVIPRGPAEIQRVGHQLNHLARRVGQLLDERSQRSADLTHRLRTPLTALRLDLDALPDSPATQRVLADYSMVTKAVDEVIQLARHAGSENPRRQPTDLTQIARERIEFWAALAEDTGRPVEHRIPTGPVLVHASAPELEATFDAVLGNIFAHTPAGAAFWVQVIERPNEAAGVIIDDSGPGFSNNAAVVERGQSGAASTGLGLDIARQTAEASGGYLQLGRSPQGGARVELWFGAALPTVTDVAIPSGERWRRRLLASSAGTGARWRN